MIQILTVFLGLVTGVQTVELRVGAPVAEVEVRLDGRAVERLAGAPWTVDVDLGTELAPHRLTAIARDAAGRELDRAERWINVADAAFAPPLEGGGLAGGAGLTAIAVNLERGAALPPPAEMRSWFLADGEPIRVLRVDEGPAEVVMVRDPAAQAHLDRAAEAFPQVRAAWEEWRTFLALRAEATIRFISPRAAPVSSVGSPKWIFSASPRLDAHSDGLLWHLVRSRPMAGEPRISDAAALAVVGAHASRRRRAVVLLLTDEAMGRSRFRPAEVRGFAARLQVPVFVWSFGEPLPEWGEVWLLAPERLKRASPEAARRQLRRLEDAFRGLRESLAAQRVVWLAGSRLPHRIRLSRKALEVVRPAGYPGFGEE